jgi:hypothetical protein
MRELDTDMPLPSVGWGRIIREEINPVTRPERAMSPTSSNFNE